MKEGDYKITDDYGGASPDGPNPSVRMQKVFDVQWSDCPIEVEKEVRLLWRHYECGNDNYIVKIDVEDLEVDYPLVYEFLISKGCEPSERVWIHWWW